jgi:hypothetical protein
MEVPNFLKRVGDALVFDLDGELVYYIPEEFFDVNIVEIAGAYVSAIGIFDYAIVSPTGKVGEVKPFRFPTVFLCKPRYIEKVKDLKIGKSKEAKKYRVLHFCKGDEVISQVRVPEIVDNVEDVFRLLVITGRIPTTIRYDIGHEYFEESLELNGNSFGLSMQLFGILWAELCRDPNDVSKPFYTTDMKDMNGYKPVSIKTTPNYVSPYVALASEQLDESIRAAILIDDDDAKYSPLEKVVTG